ncbi:nitrate reductase molybdenum cofactor assembly chaperone [Nanchangia anserum]|uniref:Nitrate reductase molybdenum cofactor assembly chaperone n=1 Tax=Nanchangia anserum TaxID=2692125 RepID=A0A8I0KTW6_9ACTO|nr:nitrate reductase molybdenum cofactor assembly chaperone [Nanchangia anserum]
MSDIDRVFDAHMALGLALDYPGGDWEKVVEAIGEADLVGNVRAHVDRFLEVATAWGPQRLREHYVRVFDNKRRCSLYVTYFDMGDTRRRGAALTTCADLYRAVGFAPPDHELPDYLPLLLQLSARSRDVLVSEVLGAMLPGIEVVRRALEAEASPYVHLLDAVRATLPSLTEDQRERVRTLIGQGPPSELVGLSDSPLPLFAKG